MSLDQDQFLIVGFPHGPAGGGQTKKREAEDANGHAQDDEHATDGDKRADEPEVPL